MNENNENGKKAQTEYGMENEIKNEAAKAEEKSGSVEEKANIRSEQSHQDKAHKGPIAKLEKELECLKAERDSLKESYQRTFSDYNNYKKRTQSAVAQAIKTGMGEAVEKLLPVLDNLERALVHSEDKEGALSKGVEMVQKQFCEVLSSMGVKEIPAEGAEFDPNLHQAIQQVEKKEGEKPGMVAQVARKGYMLDEKVLRHSMVIVNK